MESCDFPNPGHYFLFKILPIFNNRARNWNVGKAEKMLKATLEWRREYKPEEILSTDVESQIRSGHMFQMAFDKFGRPAVCLKVHTKPDPHDRDEKLQFMIYSMERAIRRMDTNRGVEKMLWLVCCEGYNMKYNGEIGFAKELLSILQNHYPERLGALVIYDAPFVFRAFWKIIYPFIDKKTQKKVTFLSGTREPGGQIHNFVNEWFDASELAKLEKYFGGTMETPFDADAYMAQLTIEESREAGGGEHHKKRRKRHRKHKKHHAEAEEEEPLAEDTAAAAAVPEHPKEPHVEATEETAEHHPGEAKKKKKKKKHKKKAHHPAEENAE